MTAFARESATIGQSLLTVEIRSVNQRYLDCSFKLPDSLRNLEAGLREQATGRLARGKVECLFRVQSQGAGTGPLTVNREQLQQVLAAAAEVTAILPASQPLNPLEVLQFPGVCQASEDSEEVLQATATELFGRALDALVAGRQREGEKLGAMIYSRIAELETETSAVRELMPGLKLQQRERLLARLAELQVDIDNSRLEQELVYLAQKADVDEELDRLQTHAGEVRRTLDKGGPCGRRLDFLMQELHREANTLSSKSIASSSTHSAVQLKVLIEQMREQVQNIE
ncbi:YicC family protein [Kineobactrum sediminis]|uniref:YicC family protein n=2 Tax=Kineobactrum sediminis TaxID=1905677 RepID=A0A2N5Y514_9GAMM|nr:YicC family protein [Kineobactrum sediminis]